MIKMIAFLGVLCLVAMTATNAEMTFPIMDGVRRNATRAKIPEVSEKSCPPVCDGLMRMGLEGVSLALSTIMSNVKFNATFCNCVVTGLGHFSFNRSCASNAKSDVFDHKISIEFNNPTAECTCHLPNNPEAAVKKILASDSPVGKCGKDEVGDKLPAPTLSCDGDETDQDGTDKEIKLQAAFKRPVLEIDLQVDTRGPKDVYPTKINLITQEDDPISLKNGPGFEKAWECLINDANKKGFYRKLILNVFEPIFHCMDDKNEHPRSVIDTILNYAGNCNNFASFGFMGK